MKIYPSVQKIIEAAHKMGLTAESTGRHPSGGHRRHSVLGSTHSPNKTVIIEGIAFSNGGADQYLSGKSARAISDMRCES